MLNTGKLLRRPGESEYSRYRRFLIANHGTHSGAQRIRQELLKYASSMSPSVYSGINNLKLIEILESKEPTLDQFYVESRFVYPRAHKNCPACSEIGYHSEVFNYDWMSTCPVHNTKLIVRCHICSEKWPSCCKVLSRDCLGCGAKIDFSELVAKKAFSNKQKFSDLKYLTKFASSVIEPVEYTLDSKSETKFHRCYRTNIASLFTPTAIAARDQSSNEKLQKLQDLGVRVFKQTTLAFDANEKAESKSETCSELSKDRQSEIRAEVLNTLRKNLDHKLGTCSSSSWNTVDTSCPMCRAIIIFTGLNSADCDYPPSYHSYHRYSSDLTRVRSLPKPNQAKVLQRVSIDRLVNSHHDHIKTVVIPIDIQAQLYEFELYLSFAHSLMLTDHVLKCYEKPNCNQLDAYSAAPKTMRQYGLITQPYYVHVDETKVYITFPNVLKKPRELIGHELFYGAPNTVNWTSI